MDISKAYFQKSLNDLSYTDIVKFFQEQRTESDNIEFKSIPQTSKGANDQIPALTVGICSFLNSNGGILIWGAPKGENVTGQKGKVFQGDLTPTKEAFEKDWLISKISDSIIPLPNQINMRKLEDNDLSIFVFEIQKSLYSPHQTDHRFYMRIDGQNKPAPHHYIEALFKKIQFPNIEAYLQINTLLQAEKRYECVMTISFYNWTSYQNEENLHFKLTSRYGSVNNSSASNLGESYNVNPAKLVFYSGELFQQSVRVYYPALSLPTDLKVPLTLYFGGRYSPLKISKFELDFSNVKPLDFNDIIVERIENQFAFDEGEFNKETIIKAFLKN